MISIDEAKKVCVFTFKIMVTGPPRARRRIRSGGHLLPCNGISNIVQGDTLFKDLLRYPLAREGVYGQAGLAFLAHTKQKVSNIVGLTALRLAFFMGDE